MGKDGSNGVTGMKRDLTEGNVAKALLLFAGPMILGNMLQQVYNIADTLIVGRVLGEEALAAVGSAYTLMTFLTSVIIGLCIGERIAVYWSVPAVLGVGFVAYGLSIYFYVYAQRLLGAARTSAYYAVAPFIAALLSLAIFRELPSSAYFAALFFMGIGAWLSSQDKPLLQ